jgi:hypothetical protein
MVLTHSNVQAAMKFAVLRATACSTPYGSVLLLPLFALSCFAQIQTNIGLRLTREAGVPQVETIKQLGHMLLVEHSANLQDWTEVARVLGQLYPYGDWFRSNQDLGFYRGRSWPAQDLDDWSNQLVAKSPALFKPGSGSGLAAISYVKWSLLLNHVDRVYFQDSVRYSYHIQYARARLPGYANMSTLEYNAQALYANASQRMVVGSVFRAPDPQVREVGIEVTGAEAFQAMKVVDWVEAVRRRVIVEPGWRVFYMPSTEQRSETQANLPLFAARGIEVSSVKRWATANACYSAGWALGRLVYVPSPEIQTALEDGRLAFTDILVTDLVPAELPVLAGYLCLEPATPNSHVALLARSLLLPFAYANGDGLQAEIASLYGREVLLIVEETNSVCRISLKDTTGLLTPERRKEILDSKLGGPIDITPKATRGALTVPVDDLTPADIKYVGGKAAHFGFLRRSLPEDTPYPVLAITFDLWDAYLDQTLPGGETLRQFIVARLSKHTYPPNVAELRTDLAIIQSVVEQTADFTPAATIMAALQGAGLQGANIRFRSSTNVEDSESFSGAGLYDSYSGCLEDDLDEDTAGPSRCDPTESKERGVFRAMRKVYASFYNENAFLERLRHGVDEAEVGMAILVHFSVTDANEMANGVVTLAVEKAEGQRSATVRIVTQLGAESVTNPDVSIRPEIVSASYSGQDTTQAALSLDERSTLIPESAPVMLWETDYRTLLSQANTAALAYEQYYPAKTRYELDFEFKRIVPGDVGLKQMRAVPHPTPVPPPSIP